MTIRVLPDPTRVLEVGIGRIAYPVTIESFSDPAHRIECPVAIVDTGAYCLTLPLAWKDRLGTLPLVERLQVQTADRRVVEAELCGPLKVQIGRFEPIGTSVLFVPMEGDEENYVPLIGFLTLEQARLTVDVVFHRLIRIPTIDMRFVDCAM